MNAAHNTRQGPVGLLWRCVGVLAAAAALACNQSGPSAEPEMISVILDASSELVEAGVPPVLYPVSGRLEGVVGSVVLTLGAQELTLSKNGPFTFKRGLRDGDSYAVEVSQHPEGEFCLVEDGSGVIDGAAVSDVQVYCEPTNPGITGLSFSAGWLTPAFDADTTRYRVDVPLWVEHLQVEPELVNNDVAVEVAGQAYRGQPVEVALQLGLNTLSVVSRAENGDQSEYVLEVYRAAEVVETAYGKAREPQTNANFAGAMAVEGNWLVVGSPGQASGSAGVNGDESTKDAQDSGAVYVFERTERGIEQVAFLKAHNAQEGDLFGFAVALSGNRIVVGAPEEDSRASGVNGRENEDAPGSGAVYVFERDERTFEQVAFVKPAEPGIADGFGRALALQGDRLVVGAWHEASSLAGVNSTGDKNTEMTNAGAAYVFEFEKGGWVQTTWLKAAVPGRGDDFGESVALDGDTLVIGASFERSLSSGVNADAANDEAFQAGAAYVFKYDAENQTWFQDAYLKPSVVREGQRFGYAVAVSGHTVAVGAPTENSGASGVDGDGADESVAESGAVFVFTGEAGEWQQQAYLKASNSAERGHFGHALGLNGRSLVVTAPYESNALSGVEAPQGDQSALGAGAAYVFARSGGSWEQVVYLKASNAEPGDTFGSALAFDGTQLVMGAPTEGSGLGGVHTEGGPNNALFTAGAFYVFE